MSWAVVRMSREIFEFIDPERLVIGTVGQPGERQFFLQVASGTSFRSFALEKSQASALASRCKEILREIAAKPGEFLTDNAPLTTPIEPEFVIGVMSLLWDAERERFLLEAQAATSGNDDILVEDLLNDGTEGAPAILRILFGTVMARAFIKRTEEVVASGRMPCMFCGGPVDASGHLCPRSNGFRRREP